MLSNFLGKLNEALEGLDVEELVDAIDKANLVYKARIFVVGNGGSASIASHFVQDMVKIRKVDAMCLADNTALVMAYANDTGYKNIFSKQLDTLSKNVNDLVIAFSCSGDSPNILEVEYWCQKNGRKFICIHGDNDYEYLDGYNIKVNSFHYGIIESAFSLICHYVVSRLRLE